MDDQSIILVIEDDEPIREALKDLLTQEGYQVVTAVNGKDGIEVLNTISKPCLILLDLFMPVMSGIQFLEALRQDQEHVVASLPIVAISASPPDGEAAKAVKPFVRGFVKKPVDLEMLFSVAEKYCVKKKI